MIGVTERETETMHAVAWNTCGVGGLGGERRSGGRRRYHCAGFRCQGQRRLRWGVFSAGRAGGTSGASPDALLPVPKSVASTRVSNPIARHTPYKESARRLRLRA